jgi:putative CocE/NonD family hydrolase
MARNFWRVGVLALGALAGWPSFAGATPGPVDGSETPAHFQAAEDGFDFARREAMIPMRDGVKLHTVILVPNGAGHAPILLTRTPYNADDLTSHVPSGHLASVLQGYDNATDVIVEAGYIRVVQDVRGKYRSEGDYVMNRPIRGPLNPTAVDHATDTWDTIDWLVKHVPESNGRVGIIGISYDGFTPLMALVNPHPALKVAVPMNPMVDGWRGDDWFHNGAFRQLGIPYIFEQEATRSNDEKWWANEYDYYDEFLRPGSAGELARRHGLEQMGFWRKLAAHPAYDSFWQGQAMDRILAGQPLKVPVLLVHSLWDQEDIYGAIAVYQALAPKDTGNDMVHLAIGPWYHGQSIGDGSALGAIRFGSDTALTFRQTVLRPFLDHYLKDGAPPAEIAKVTAFETGTNRWEQLKSWPSGCAAGCPVTPTPLYLQPGLKLGFTAPEAAEPGFEEYVSDPAKPVPFIPRPMPSQDFDDSVNWRTWLVSDQREASGRPDVLAFTSELLTQPVKISGQPVARISASTTGTDGDFVVKLIDVYPDEVPAQRELGGYQLMISADILRGRYRESFETPHPIEAGRTLVYRFVLPTANHVFLPGHRIMVQIQSSWFPLYDRNPQSYVDNILFAKPKDYRKATIRIFDAGAAASFVELPLVAAH